MEKYDVICYFQIKKRDPFLYIVVLPHLVVATFDLKYSSGPRHRRWCVQACATAPTDDLQSSALLDLETQSFFFVLVVLHVIELRNGRQI